MLKYTKSNKKGESKVKLASKILIIISMVLTWYLIFPLVIGFFALKQLEECRQAKELTTIAIITLICCNTIAGIIMLCMKDEDLLDNGTTQNNADNLFNDVTTTNTAHPVSDTTATVTDKENSTEQSTSPTHKVIKLLTIICFCVTLVAVIMYFVFAIIGASNYNGSTWLSVTVSSLQLISITTIVISYFKNKQSFSSVGKILVLVFISLSLLALIFALVSYCGGVYETYGYYDYTYNYTTGKYYRQYVTDHRSYLYEYIFCIACAGTNILTSLLLLLFSLLKIKQGSKNSGQKSATTLQRKATMESELTNAKLLLEKNIITEEEYNKIRQTIIDKYFKQN